MCCFIYQFCTENFKHAGNFYEVSDTVRTLLFGTLNNNTDNV